MHRHYLSNLTLLIITARIISEFLFVMHLHFGRLLLHNLLKALIMGFQGPTSIVELIIQMQMIPSHFLVDQLLSRHLEWVLLLKVGVPFDELLILFPLNHQLFLVIVLESLVRYGRLRVRILL